jgi:TIR domain
MRRDGRPVGSCYRYSAHMANLREYFLKELDGFGVHAELILSTSTGQITIVERVNFDTRAGVNFVSYFFPTGTFTLPLARHLLDDPAATLGRFNDAVSTTLSHPVSDPEGIVAGDQPLSGRVYMYVDDYVAESQRLELREYGLARGVRLQLRDKRHSDFCTEHETPWAFISHDSRDKDDVARPLAQTLSSMLCPVWYDEYSLDVGDSLRESIDNGLRDAKRCIIVVSPNFLSNPGWTKAELNAAMGKHIAAGGSVILPIWHNVSRNDVFQYSPMLADLVGLSSTLGTDEMARRLFLKLGA